MIYMPSHVKWRMPSWCDTGARSVSGHLLPSTSKEEGCAALRRLCLCDLCAMTRWELERRKLPLELLSATCTRLSDAQLLPSCA